MSIFKVVKLNHRHNATAYGYTIALKFNAYGSAVSRIEGLVTDAFGDMGLSVRSAKQWFGDFGYTNGGIRTYWIYFRREEDIAFMLLRIS
jgi:hypothetical protein